MPARAAWIAFALYLGASLLAGERFPFSRYDMYASLGDRKVGAVLAFRVDGNDVDVRRFDRFAGFDPANLLPEDTPCSMEYAVEDARRWMEAHRAAADAPPGPVRLEIGYWWITVEGGRIVRDFRPIGEAMAWRR
jgi:hypothetical protein